VLSGALAVVVTSAMASALSVPVAVSAAPVPTVHVKPAVVGHIAAQSRLTPLSTTDCLAQIGIHCYSPVQYRNAYDLNPLYAHGITGAGRTIVIVDSFGSPTIQADLEAFDAQWGFPNTTVQIERAGVIPPFDPNDDTMVGWAQETTLDVEYATPSRPARTSCCWRPRSPRPRASPASRR